MIHVNIRGRDHRGEYTIQMRVEAPTLLDALGQVLSKWDISASTLTRVHIEPVEKGEPKPA